MDIDQARRLMHQAIDLAKSSGEDLPIGCLIVRPGQQLHEPVEIVSFACNEKEKLQDPTAHAEIQAIRKACQNRASWRLDATYLITTLEPCAMCAEAIIQARIEKIYFGAYDEKSGACGSAFNLFQKGRIYPLPEVIGGVEEKACSQILLDFFQQRRQT